MHLSRLKPLLFACLALLALSCDQQLNSAKDQPSVNYVLVVTDSATGAPLDSVRIRVTTITGDTSTYFTGNHEGRAELATLASSRTLFVLSRPGYQTRDSIDTVSGVVDSVFHRPLAKLLKWKLKALANQTLGSPIQFNLLLRGADLEKLRNGKVSFTDSIGMDKTVVDQDSDGTINLASLKLGKNRVIVEHPGYLGQMVDVTIVKLSDSLRTIPDNTVVLFPLKNSISGLVNYKTPTGIKPLQDALVKFQVKDSLAYKGTYQTLTSSTPGSEGRFEMLGLPPLAGELRYYKNKTALEPTLIKAVTLEEVLKDGPFAPVTLIILSDSAIYPVVDTLPKDTLSPKDTLVFHFNQPVKQMSEPTVRLINISQRLWTKSSLDSTSQQKLKIVQQADDWIPGKTYAYELTLANAQGQGFTRPGDTVPVIRGTFYVREPAKTDTSIDYPEGIRVAYFNSGNDRSFDSLHVDTSPKGDSTTRFARLKWNWKESKGSRVDSILILVKDGGIARPAWTQWLAIPGFADSATLDFSELYSTVSNKNSNPVFPLRVSQTEEIQLKVLYMKSGKTLDSQNVLSSVKQEMGPSLYAKYDSLDGFKTNTSAFVDTFEVSFRKILADVNSSFDFGSTHPLVKILIDEKPDLIHFDTNWVSNKLLRVVCDFKAGQFPGGEFSKIRVDINGTLYGGRPIWLRNRSAGIGSK